MKKLLIVLAFSFAAVISAQKNDINYYIEKAPFKSGEMVLPTIPQKDFSKFEGSGGR